MSVAPAVFLLQSKLREDDRVLVLDYECLVTLTGWLARPEANPRPDSLSAHWEGHPSGRRSEFPSFHLQAAILTPSLTAAIGPMLSRSGTLIPLLADDDGTVEVGSYQLYLVETVVDCLDVEKSSEPQQYTGFRRTVAFHPDRLPDTPAFRVPQVPTVTYWNRAAAERMVELVGPDVEPLVVWSLDPDLPVHPNPMATRM
ncbi:MAG TPA: hypothetical protein VLL08_32050 [Kineosporiaceae bacterium]|nr:hypothetical protein [Kineosporiaceae bacterium]